MKKCPICQQIYTDPELNFCESDGAVLLSISNSREEQTVIIPSQSVQPVIRQGVNPIFAYLTVGLFALIAGGAIVLFLKSDSNNSANSTNNNQLQIVENNKTNNQEAGDFQNRNLKQEQPKVIENNQMLSSQNVRKDNSITQNSSSTPIPPKGSWLVILGSYEKYENEKASQKLRYIQGLGYDASILYTDNYPKLTSNLQIVAMGPYSKSYAQSLARQIKSKGAEVYIKAGW